MVKEIRKLGIPDYIGIQTEKAQFWGKPEQGSVQTEDVEVTVEQGEENDAVMLHAKYSAVKWVKLHWNMEISSNARIFADEWERGYGNMEWKGMNPNRMFPWYFLHYGEDEYERNHPLSGCPLWWCRGTFKGKDALRSQNRKP